MVSLPHLTPRPTLSNPSLRTKKNGSKKKEILGGTRKAPRGDACGSQAEGRRVSVFAFTGRKKQFSCYPLYQITGKKSRQKKHFREELSFLRFLGRGKQGIHHSAIVMRLTLTLNTIQRNQFGVQKKQQKMYLQVRSVSGSLSKGDTTGILKCNSNRKRNISVSHYPQTNGINTRTQKKHVYGTRSECRGFERSICGGLA